AAVGTSRQLVTSGPENAAFLYRMPLVEVVTTQELPLTAICWLAGGTDLVVGSDDGTLALWRKDAEAGTWKAAASLAGCTEAVTDVAVTDKDDLVAAVSLDGLTRVWELPASDAEPDADGFGPSVTFAHGGPVHGVALAPGGN